MAAQGRRERSCCCNPRRVSLGLAPGWWRAAEARRRKVHFLTTMAPTALLASTIVAARVQQASGTRARRAAACPQQLRAPCPANVRSLPSARNARQSVAVAAGRFQPIVFAAAAAPPDWQVRSSTKHLGRQSILNQEIN